MTESSNGNFTERENEERFYQLIGHCVTKYQAVEDHLSEVFIAALGTEKARAQAIYSVARGLDAKLNIISAALIGSPHITRWEELLPRVTKAASARNEIAHAETVYNGGNVTITLNEDFEAVDVAQTSPARMELHKKTAKNLMIWTLDQMRAEHERSRKLFLNLIGFTQILRGETPSPHLLEE